MQKMASITSKDAIFYSERCHLLQRKMASFAYQGEEMDMVWYNLEVNT